MGGNGQVMLTAALGCKAYVTAGLVADFIPQPTQRVGQIHAGNVSRELHSASTSSRT
jgi:hypothetical protein